MWWIKDRNADVLDVPAGVLKSGNDYLFKVTATQKVHLGNKNISNSAEVLVREDDGAITFTLPSSASTIALNVDSTPYGHPLLLLFVHLTLLTWV